MVPQVLVVVQVLLLLDILVLNANLLVLLAILMEHHQLLFLTEPAQIYLVAELDILVTLLHIVVTMAL